jgi:hypothetical protein
MKLFCTCGSSNTDIRDYSSSCSLDIIDKPVRDLAGLLIPATLAEFCRFNLALKTRGLAILKGQQSAVYYHVPRKGQSVLSSQQPEV